MLSTFEILQAFSKLKNMVWTIFDDPAFVQLINILKSHLQACPVAMFTIFKQERRCSHLNRKKNITSWVIFVFPLPHFISFFGSVVRFQQNDTDLHIDLHVILLLVPLKKKRKEEEDASKVTMR